MLDRSVAPKSGALQFTNLIEPVEHNLANGCRLFVLNAGDQPVIKFEIQIEASIWQEKTAGISWFTAKMLAEGSVEKSAHKIASIFDFFGAHIEISPGFDHTSISLYCLKRHFESTLILFQEVLYKPVFPEKELDTLLNIRRQQIRLNNEKNGFISSKNIRKALYGSVHPYGRSLSEKDLEAINTSALKHQFDNGFIGKQVLFLSGLVGTTEVQLVSQLFGGLSFEETSVQYEVFNKEQSANASEEKPNSLQSAIKFGWHIPDKNHPDHYKLLVTNEVLGGYFGSRLMRNLREEKGLTYGINSYPIFLRKAAFLLIGTEVVAEKTQLAHDEIIREIEILKNEKMDGNELQTVTNYMAGSFLSKISTPFHLMDKFQSLHQHNLDYSYYENFFEALKSITPNDIKETANSYLDINKMSTAVAGKVSSQ
jgi:zinc protease